PLAHPEPASHRRRRRLLGLDGQRVRQLERHRRLLDRRDARRLWPRRHVREPSCSRARCLARSVMVSALEAAILLVLFTFLPPLLFAWRLRGAERSRRAPWHRIPI